MIETYCNTDLETGGNDGSTEADAWQTFAAAIAGTIAGERLNVKRTAARVTDESNQTFSNNATGTGPIHIRGYTDTIGDGGFFEWGHTLDITGDHVIVEGIDVDVAANSDSAMTQSGSGALYRCKAKNTGTGSAVALTISNGCAYHCSFMVTQSTTRAMTASSKYIIEGCRIETNNDGINMSLGFADGMVSRCLIIGDGSGNGIDLDNMDTMHLGYVGHNTFYNFTNAVNILDMPDVGDSVVAFIVANIAYNCTNGFTNVDEGVTNTTVTFALNATGAISSDSYQFGDQPLLDEIILASNDPFENAGTDFRIDSGSTGGALVAAGAASPAYAWSL